MKGATLHATRYIYMNIYAYLYKLIYIKLHMYRYIYMYIYIYTYIYMYIYTERDAYTYIYVSIHTDMEIHVYKFLYIYIMGFKEFSPRGEARRGGVSKGATQRPAPPARRQCPGSHANQNSLRRYPQSHDNQNSSHQTTKSHSPKPKVTRQQQKLHRDEKSPAAESDLGSPPT